MGGRHVYAARPEKPAEASKATDCKEGQSVRFGGALFSSAPPRLSFYPLPNLKKKKSSQHLTQSLASCLLIHTIRVRIRATASSLTSFDSLIQTNRHERADNSIYILPKIKMNILCICVCEQQLIDDVHVSLECQTGGGARDHDNLAANLYFPSPQINSECVSFLCCRLTLEQPRNRGKVSEPPRFR